METVVEKYLFWNNFIEFLFRKLLFYSLQALFKTLVTTVISANNLPYNLSNLYPVLFSILTRIQSRLQNPKDFSSL